MYAKKSKVLSLHVVLCISLNLLTSRLKLPSLKKEVSALEDKEPFWVWSPSDVFLMKSPVHWKRLGSIFAHNKIYEGIFPKRQRSLTIFSSIIS